MASTHAGLAAVAGEGEATIFVSIASYRDSQCQYTLQDLFNKAKYPKRVVAGVCFQVAAEDEDNFCLNLDKWHHQIRTCFLPHDEAKGPCYARALIQQELFKSEDYYFQVDSHLRFAQDWDVLCIEQLQRCASDKPVLTSYVSSYTLPKDYMPGEPDRASLSPGQHVTIICADRFGDQNQDDPFLRIKTRACHSNFEHEPPPALFWTARFAFSRGAVVHEVPYDPHLEYIFFGEEIGMAARLWTSGWDLFNPTKVIAYHLGSRAHRHWFRQVQSSPDKVQKEEIAKGRLCGLFGIRWPLEQAHAMPEWPYGLGSTRTLAEYEEFCGVDFRKQQLNDRAINGGLDESFFPPRWAEEEREKISHITQMQDPSSWAGKDNEVAAQRQFPGVAANGEASSKGTMPLANPPGGAPQLSGPELAKAREMARVRIHALQAQRGSGAADPQEAELELSRAFSNLGKLEAASGDAAGKKSASEAYSRAQHHAEAASGAAPADLEDDAFWFGSAKLAEATAQLGLERFGDAKGSLLDALGLVSRALRAAAKHGSSIVEAEQLAHDVAEAIHNAHERTDDRDGLQRYIRGLRDLLSALRAAAPGEAPLSEVIPRLSDADRPQDVNASQVTLRGRLLERVALICVATGREKDMAVVKKVFTDFNSSRTSPNLIKLLGMLQSSGHFI